MGIVGRTGAWVPRSSGRDEANPHHDFVAHVEKDMSLGQVLLGVGVAVAAVAIVVAVARSA